MPLPILQSLRQLPRAEYASKLAIISGQVQQRKLSHSDLHREIEQNAALLRLAGFTPGVPVALYVKDELDYIIVFLSCVWVGVVVHPIPFSCSEEDIKSIILARNLKTIIFSNNQGSQVSMIGEKIATELGLHVIQVKQTINEGTKMELHELKTLSFEERHYKIEPHYLALVDQVGDNFSDQTVSFTHEQISTAVHMISTCYGPQSDDIVCLVCHPVSVSILVTNVLVALTNGCPIIISSGTTFHTESIVNKATSLGVTWLAAPLSTLSTILTYPKAASLCNQLKCVWCLSTCPFAKTELPSLQTLRQSLSCPLFLVVGLRSSLSLTFQYLVETFENRQDDDEYLELGKPFANIQTLLVNPDTGDIESAQGELWISGDILSKDSLTERCNDSLMYMKTGWIVRRNQVGLLQPVETMQQYQQTKTWQPNASSEIQPDDPQVIPPPQQQVESPKQLVTPPPLPFSCVETTLLSSSVVDCASPNATLAAIHRTYCLPLLPYDDEEPGYFQVGKSTFCLAEIDFLLQLLPSVDHAKSFLVSDQVHVAMTLQPGSKVTAASLTKHLKQWGIVREGVVPVHYYVCRQWKPCTRQSIKQYCLSMPQHKVKEACTESTNPPPLNTSRSGNVGSWFSRFHSKDHVSGSSWKQKFKRIGL